MLRGDDELRRPWIKPLSTLALPVSAHLGHALVERRHERRLLQDRVGKNRDGIRPATSSGRIVRTTSTPGWRRTRKASATARPRSVTWCSTSDI
jgi:hypothetical protein